MTDATHSFVSRSQIEPSPPPALVGGPIAWIRDNLFSSVLNTVLTLLGIALLYVILPPLLKFLVIDAVWTGTDRDACLSEKVGFQVGACWAYVADRFSYFIYGSYPVASRLRVDVVFVLGAIGIVWLLWLDAPRRDIGAGYFFLVFPVLGFILLVGGDYDFNRFVLGRLSTAVPQLWAWPITFGFELSNVKLTFGGMVSALIELVGGLLAPVVAILAKLLALVLFPFAIVGAQLVKLGGAASFWSDFLLTAVIATALSVIIGRAFGKTQREASLPVLVVFAGLGAMLLALSIDWGLEYVPTNLWGGILVTLVVSLVGIVFSLPIGILLALGRRSRLPVIRLFCVIFIEFVRGVPLITVLFMANTMLPLFLPGSASPDRLLRALVGVAMFASAYMAEVIRGGLQAMPKGQYEGAMSLGLGYWQMMRLIILPQALRIVIPGIVNTFIGLFKDTTLVFIVGIFDFLKTIDATLVDPTWATPTSRYTGYAFAAVFYFVCCYGMSRYSLSVERRMAAGHKR